jgi:hypothetical protein
MPAEELPEPPPPPGKTNAVIGVAVLLLVVVVTDTMDYRFPATDRNPPV